MKSLDWYNDWRHEAVHQLQGKNARLQDEFRLSSWPRYDYDVDAGTLTFSKDGVAKVIAEIQLVGTTSTNAGNWLWAWANAYWPTHIVSDSEFARAFGEEHGIRELTSDYVEDSDLDVLGWALSAVTARVTDAPGAYRPPGETGSLFLILRSVRWAN